MEVTTAVAVASPAAVGELVVKVGVEFALLVIVPPGEIHLEAAFGVEFDIDVVVSG